MGSALREALEAGALGISSDYLADHVGYRGKPLACKLASERELSALSSILCRAERTISSIAVNSMHSGTRLISDEDVRLLGKLVDEGGGKATFVPVLAKAGEPDFHARTLEKLKPFEGRLIPQTSLQPFVFTQTLKKPFKFGYYETFRRAMNRTIDEQLALYQSTSWRREAREELDAHERQYPWDRTRVLAVTNAELSPYVGRTLAEIARAEGSHPLDVLAEIACKDDLATRFQVQKSNYDLDGIAWMLRRDDFLVGLSDGGAHVDQLCDSCYPSIMLGSWVRERKVLTLEEAVRKMTSVPARLYGIEDRGVLAEGMIADLVLFDADEIKHEPPRLVCDLPLGAERLVSKSVGITAVYVSGRPIWTHGEPTGEHPGRVLRPRRGNR
jgi:N-acyl-D-aspartate/D-glutamate deacylase